AGFPPVPGYVAGESVLAPSLPGCWRGYPAYYAPGPVRVYRWLLRPVRARAEPDHMPVRSAHDGARQGSDQRRFWLVLPPALYLRLAQGGTRRRRNVLLPVPTRPGAHRPCPVYAPEWREEMVLHAVPLPSDNSEGQAHTLRGTYASLRW